MGWAVRADLLAGAGALAVLAAWVAMSLPRGEAAAAPASRWWRLANAGTALVTGAWSGYFIATSAARFPEANGYPGGLLFAAFSLTLVLALAAIVLGQPCASAA